MRQPQKKHLMGGTIKGAIATEIKRVLHATGGHREVAAVTLGISNRTLEKWIKNWDELKEIREGLEAVFGAATQAIKKSKPKKKAKAKKASARKKPSKTQAQTRAA